MLDVGSGAGLPGIPLAIARDDCTLVLIEGRSRRAAFLELAKETLGLSNTQVVHGRAEEYAWRGRVAVARAVADPQKAWQMCRPLLERGGFLVYFAGRSWADAPGPGACPVAAKWKICGKPLFPWQGPIIKMWASEERLPTA
jgi:16S rRNA (guanine527-N7)-methyltransferase